MLRHSIGVATGEPDLERRPREPGCYVAASACGDDVYGSAIVVDAYCSSGRRSPLVSLMEGRVGWRPALTTHGDGRGIGVLRRVSLLGVAEPGVCTGQARAKVVVTVR